MSTIALVTRREALRLVAATLASNVAVDAFGQKSSTNPPSFAYLTTACTVHTMSRNVRGHHFR